MKFNKYILCLLFWIGFYQFGQAQALEMQGICSVNCVASQFCVTVKMKAIDATPVIIGSSSILITYDPAAMIFQSVTPLEFDGTDNCNAGQPAWELPTSDGTESGTFSMTVILKEGQQSNSCPTIDDQTWVDVALVCFTILNNNVYPAVSFDTSYTHVNASQPNDGTVMVPIVSYEVYSATCAADTDSDGVANIHDNCVSITNPLQEDSDDDGIGDACDPQCNFIVAASPDMTVCQGSNVTLAALSQNGISPFTYLWSTGDTTSSVSITANSFQQYHVTMTDADSCVGMADMDVDISLGALTSVVIYDLDSAVIFDTLHDGDILNYSVLPPSFNFQVTASGDVESIGFILEGAQFDTDYENSIPYRYPGDFQEVEPVTGNYTLTVTTFSENNLHGVSCDQAILNFSIVNDCATVYLPEVVALCLGETITINSNVQGTHGAYSVDWSNGMTGDSITITPTETFYLFVTVTDQSNCITQAAMEVHVTSADILTLLLWDLDSDTVYDTILGGEIYNIDSLPDNYNIRAIPIAGNTESIGFDLAADFGVWGHTENQAPYEFPGGNINFWQDNFTMTVAAWDEDWRNGYSCGSYSFSFQVADIDPSCNLVTNTSDSGVGSLPYALQCAQWWQTVYFDPALHHDTIVLQSAYALFSTGAELSALAEHEVYIKAAGTGYALYINPGVETRIDGVHIISGTAVQGAAIYNEGNVTIENVTVHPHPGMSTVEPIFNTGTLSMRGTVDVKNE